jgi:hypothetical protein
MFVGAFIDAGVKLDDLRSVLASMNLGDVSISADKVKRSGMAGTKFNVVYGDENEERTLSSITRLIEQSSLGAQTIQMAVQVFARLGEAESRVHSKPIEEIHFHEVGAVDSIVDIVLGCACVEMSGLEKLYSREIAVGSGTVEMAHGRLAVPAPATLELLKGWTLGTSGVRSELTTPTGAALVSVLCRPLPLGTLFAPGAVGYGAGERELEGLPNLLRLTVAETRGSAPVHRIRVIEVTLDDISGEVIGYLYPRLLEMGALDVFTTAVLMKKSRPGILLTVLSRVGEFDEIASFLLKETGSLGLRFRDEDRLELGRTIESVTTEFGEIRMKVACGLDGVRSASPEYEDCAAIARERNIPLAKVFDAATKAWGASADE